MALETCLRVSTIGAPSTPAAAASTKFAHAHYLPHPRPKKLQLPTCRAPRAAAAFFSPSTPPSPSQHRRGRRGGLLVCEAKNAVAEVLNVTEATWGKLVTEQKDKVVLVDFWAPWCGPCRMIAPIIDELARQYSGKVVCLKLNTDESPGVASQFGIRSIPTVLFFKNGEKKESVIGAVPKSTLSAAIDKYLEL